MDSDSENEKPQEEIKHKIRCKDMNLKQSKEIISITNKAFQENKNNHDKDIASQIVETLNKSSNFESGEGSWQCCIGRNFGCSLTFEAHLLILFDLPEYGKTILLFKAG